MPRIASVSQASTCTSRVLASFHSSTLAHYQSSVECMLSDFHFERLCFLDQVLTFTRKQISSESVYMITPCKIFPKKRENGR